MVQSRCNLKTILTGWDTQLTLESGTVVWFVLNAVSGFLSYYFFRKWFKKRKAKQERKTIAEAYTAKNPWGEEK